MNNRYKSKLSYLDPRCRSKRQEKGFLMNSGIISRLAIMRSPPTCELAWSLLHCQAPRSGTQYCDANYTLQCHIQTTAPRVIEIKLFDSIFCFFLERPISYEGSFMNFWNIYAKKLIWCLLCSYSFDFTSSYDFYINYIEHIRSV